MATLRPALPLALLLISSACASSIPASPSPVAGAPACSTVSQKAPRTVEGTLTAVRCFLTLGAPSGENRYCSFVDLRAGASAGLVTDAENLVYLAGNASSLAEHVGERLRVSGPALYEGRLIAAAKVAVLANGEWRPLPTWLPPPCHGPD